VRGRTHRIIKLSSPTASRNKRLAAVLGQFPITGRTYQEFALELRSRRATSLRSAANEAFLNSLESWLDSHGEVLILIRYSRAAGNKDFEFHTSFPSLRQRLRQLPSETCVTAFRTLQLQLRGIVNDAFIRKCLSSIPEGSEYAVVEMVPTTPPGRFSSFDFSAGESVSSYSPIQASGRFPLHNGKKDHGTWAGAQLRTCSKWRTV